MTCKACYHYEACKSMLEAQGYAISEEHMGNAQRCDTFKDKSLILELPCKVGDTVYVIVDMDNPARKMLECKVISISVKEASIYFQFQTVKKYLYRYGSFNIDEIGKTVFLTPEEAEQKLKECESE